MLRLGTLSRAGAGIDPLAMEFAILDTETTGLDPGDRICEIAIVRMRGDGTVHDEYSTLVNPGRPIDNTPCHGIADADVAAAPCFGDVAAELLRQTSGAVLVGHNLAFDAAMVAAEFARLDDRRLQFTGLCTLATARAQLDLPAYRLHEALRALTGVASGAWHRALVDARGCARLLVELVTRAPTPLHYLGPPAPPTFGVAHFTSAAPACVRALPPGAALDLVVPPRPVRSHRPPWHAFWRPVELPAEAIETGEQGRLW